MLRETVCTGRTVLSTLIPRYVSDIEKEKIPYMVYYCNVW